MSVSKTEFQRFAQLRFDEAILLLQADQYAGAYYLAGYAVECALKAVVCNLFRQETLPDRGLVNSTYTHDLNKLLALSGLKPLLDARTTAEPVFAANWAIASAWSEDSRYAFLDRVTAHAMLGAVGDQKAGVFPWIRLNW